MSVLELVPLIGIPLILASVARIALQTRWSASQESKIRRWVSLVALFFVIGIADGRFSWFFIGFFAFSLSLVPTFLIHHRKKQIQGRLLGFLDEVLAGVRSGDSFRKSMREAALRQEGIFKKVAIDWVVRLENGGVKSGLDPWSLQLMQEWEDIDRSRHRQSQDLKSLRQFFQIHFDFRRKSSLATLQTRLQSFLACFLYVPALILNLIWFDGGLSGPHFISLALFLTSQAWILTHSRRLKWKI